ncbi:autophagy-related protein 27-domain-containing protein [Mycena crocata]|nr:autophagy-related protein 27-domain-containing protein [Mycena crocata]
MISFAQCVPAAVASGSACRGCCSRTFLLPVRITPQAATLPIANLEFNLCPLFSGTPTSVSFAEDTPPTHTAYHYAVSLGAPLKLDATLPSQLQCPSGTWICLKVVNTRLDHPSEPSRVLQVVPVAGGSKLNPKAKLVAKAHVDDLHTPLQVTLHGDLYNRQSQKASFQFHCDHDLLEPTLPEFSWQWNGTHAFSWRTKHACPRVLPPGAPGPKPEEPDADPPATPPPDPDADVEDGDIERTLTPISAVSILFWLSVFVFAIRISYPSLFRWSRRLALCFSSTNRSFTTQDSGLPASSPLRWAAKDNSEEYDTHFPDGEGTPLTPTARDSFALGQYGSAG